MATDFRGFVVAILVIISLVAAIAWVSQLPAYMNCLKKTSGSADCLTSYITASPPVKDATDLAQACNQTDANCIVNIGERMIERKLSDEK